MYLRTEIMSPVKLIGIKTHMSIINNQTAALWQQLMPRRKDIAGKTGTDLYSVEIYDPGYFENFNPAAIFEKWAAIPVTDFESVPAGMEPLTISGGYYAVFLHKGPAGRGPETYNYIFREWLPASGYTVDYRPHFALMGEKYRNNDPDSEEELWVPIIKNNNENLYSDTERHKRRRQNGKNSRTEGHV